MTPDEIRARAVGFRNCGLEQDAELLEALAGVYEVAQESPRFGPLMSACAVIELMPA